MALVRVIRFGLPRLVRGGALAASYVAPIRGLVLTAAAGYCALKTVSSIWNTPQERITSAEGSLATTIEHRPLPGEERLASGTLVPVSEALEADGNAELHRSLAAAAASGGAGNATKRARISAFYRHWMARARLEFPLRQNRPSDKAAMSKWLHAAMREKGIRCTHAADAIPKVVAMAINPSRAEIEAEQWAEHAKCRTVGEGWLFSLKRRFNHVLGFGAAEAGGPPGF